MQGLKKQADLTPNPEALKNQLEFLYGGVKPFDDGTIEISSLKEGKQFSLDMLDQAITQAVAYNKAGKNTYLTGALLKGCTGENGRSCNSDFYASQVIWCDIDDYINPEALKSLYSHCPPNVAVITARQPTRRVQLWWKLDKPLDEPDTLIQALSGVQKLLKGDPLVVKPSSLMRAAGTVNFPNEKKRADGRINEVTEFKLLHDKKVSIETFLLAYPVTHEFFDDNIKTNSENAKIYTSGTFGLSPEKIVDGRDAYMSNMLYATIKNLTAKNGCWPTAQEVYDDAWPVYSRKVAEREGRSLEQDGRGQKDMVGKIKCKMRSFTAGRIPGCETIEKVIESQNEYLKKKEPEHKQQEHAEQPEQSQPSPSNNNDKKRIEFIMADDIKPVIETNDFVQGLLGKSQLSVIYGESNCGKTFFATDLAFHIGIGKEWRGRRVNKGGVIYAALEGSYGLRNRVQAFRMTHGLDGALFAMVASQIDFMAVNGNIDQFIDCIKRASDIMGTCDLVVIDTLARALAGGDENSGQDMGMLVHHADKIRHNTGAHVSFIHHSGKDRAKGARGHSSLRAAVDTEIEILREPDANYSTVKIAKQREMEADEDMYFELEKVVIATSGLMEEITSCVVKPIDKENIVRPQHDKILSAMQQFIYDAIVNAIAVSREKLTPREGMYETVCISYETLRIELERRGFKEMVDDSKAKTVTNNVRLALKRAGKIDFTDGWIWLTIKD